MRLSTFLSYYAHDERIAAVVQSIQNSNNPLSICNIRGSAQAVAMTALAMQTSHTQLYIADTKEDALSLHADVQMLLPDKEIHLFLSAFKKPHVFDTTLSHNILSRTQVLDSLSRYPKGQIIFTYAEALLEKVVSESILKDNTLHLKVAAKVDTDFMFDVLLSYGFERVDFVYEPGEFSIRGGIVDIYSYGNENPYRIELFGNEVESIRIFDPQSQLSQKKVSELTIIPDVGMQEKVTQYVSLLDYLHENAIIWVQDKDALSDRLHTQYGKMIHISNLLHPVHDAAHPLRALPLDDQFSIPDDIIHKLLIQKIITINKTISEAEGESIDWNTTVQPSFNKNFDLLIKTLQQYSVEGYKNMIWSDNAKQIERFYHIFEDLKAGNIFEPMHFALNEGYIDNHGKMLCFTDHQIFERFHKYANKEKFSREKMLTLKSLQDLQPGDYVTHIDHGVGKFSGLQKLDINGNVQEAVRIIYRDNDILYVNIQSLHKISKYSGKDGTVPNLNKLGSEAWNNLKEKTKKKVKEVAFDLITLYAKRKVQRGFAFSKDNYLQDELEASFMYEDTPDQLAATIDVKKDMQKPFPMDRLICGDVGFGKTEIAIRAAFKAVADGKQVAVLVPTTILAWQHYKSFVQRFKDFPVNTDYISRFKTTAEKKITLQKLKEGKLDIVIGTHALLSKNMEFKDLGLLIIDEEQKFGVGSKEKLRNMASQVDTLTLTATPIPRTLKFSMMGARDISNIMTPPPNRQPVTTEVVVFSPDTIREAINFELYRGGQVFFVHNRVQNLHEVEKMVKSLVPEADVRVAHGQMEGDALEAVMMDFINGKFDVLVSTNIIEAGLDIPNANTIMIHNAQNFGLSDLHQMRGRVGRSNRKAYCYLICPPKSSLTYEARRRLQTLEEFSDLGSGFHIAMRDLDIRGAGNLLGAEQSGFISDIGFETYQKILDEAIMELKFTTFREVFEEQLIQQPFVRECSIETDCEMLIPQEYVTSSEERLKLYSSLDALVSEEQIGAFIKVLTDRFGKIPSQVEELLDGVRLRWIAKKLGFERMILKSNKLRCYFVENQNSPYYDSPIFQNVLNSLSNQKRKPILKQSGTNFLLIYDHIRNLGQAQEVLRELAGENI